MNLAFALKDMSKELLSVIDRVVSPRSGLINSLSEEAPAAEACGIRVVHAILSPPTYYRDNVTTSLKTTERGTGAGFTRQNACWAAIGEAIERYAASIYWADKLVVATAAELGAKAIDLGKLIRAGRPEIRLFNPHTPRSWAWGTDIISATRKLVPAAMTYLGFVQSDDDEIICQKDSTGLACGNTLEGARLSALCEVLERDAFASNWLLMRKPPRLNVSGAFDHLSSDVQNALSDSRIRIRLFHLATTCSAHTVMAVLETQRGIGVVAAAASPSIVRAVEKATCEVLYSWSSACRLAGRSSIPDISQLLAPSDHLLYYLSPERFSIVKDMCGSETAVDMTSILASEHTNATSIDIARALKNEGFEPTAIDLTTTDIASLNLCVVRVVVPGLHPLIFGPACLIAPDTRRLSHWRKVWRLPERALNPHPHPFP